MITEAIILAGGLGTRLRPAVADMPKCMAPVNGKPFLYYVVEYLKKEGIENYIFSLGYKYELIENYINAQYPDLPVQYSIEKQPLGTGGAIKLACNKATQKNVLILNGDTLFLINLQSFSTFHENKAADCTLALKSMQAIDRYGIVELSNENKVVSFKEKQFYKTGLINGGIYALDVAPFLSMPLPEKFSFEKDFLETHFTSKNIYGSLHQNYFIDIGIPEDYKRAQEELKAIQFE